ncbi:beta-ketoacyl synthase [Bacillus sp. 166amftsu]|uniref:beta-ketoacyl-[acyl-carrier-protein] synthase family protein n=1 Tax=Bacillus sp. 166amftsu TaxID=1761753 RepID=UPI00089B248A|nr:beta-ketoacyl synthase [Bacillus sp. 166amftsu]SDZ40543.1 3-oxoacyl-(acyl-carrier-protein) synthase [Bacillus sp. 166amftsu]
MKKVYITGTSMISSGGIDSSNVWNSILNQKVQVQKRKYIMYDESEIEYPVYPIPKLDIKDWIKQETYSWIKQENIEEDMDFILMYIASSLALKNSKIKKRENVALIIGHENVGINNLINKVLQGPPLKKATPLEAFNQYKKDYFKLQTFPHLFYLAKALNINGAHYIINNACASGLHAMEIGSNLIKMGQADQVVVVCSDYAHVTEHMWLSEKGFSSKQGIIKPFDKQRDGSVLGDGAAAVILESENSISRRKGEVLCEYFGSVFQHDNWKLNLPDVTSHCYSKAINRALIKFNSEIDLLIPHGAGIPLWDKYESKEIFRAFKGGNLPDVTALKGYFGHTLGANSLLELCAGIQSMLSNIIPPAYNYSELDPDIKLPVGKKFRRKQINSLLKTVSAYGGFNAATIIKRV